MCEFPFAHYIEIMSEDLTGCTLDSSHCVIGLLGYPTREAPTPTLYDHRGSNYSNNVTAETWPSVHFHYIGILRLGQQEPVPQSLGYKACCCYYSMGQTSGLFYQG